MDLCCASPARIKDFLLGGGNAYAIDKAWCADATRILPSLRRTYRDEYRFLRRAIRLVAAKRGISRFLVVDAGLPDSDATHEYVAQQETSKAVYTSDDRHVLAYLELAASHHPAIDSVCGTFSVPGTILLADPTQRLLAAGTPVCLVLCGVLETIGDTADAHTALRCYTERLPSGSLVIVTHPTVDGLNPIDPAGREMATNMRQVCQAYGAGHQPERHLRTAEELRDILSGLTLIPPGIAFTSNWR
ncbi:SAM-dependent methyltransferase, partial [Amycolatopsis vastitatis]|uniref:SAM-dependent methyltransferase n=1 Tax=Amycolatopsis vastitatis TaxID=1905142 RepID=UPI001303F881